MPKKSRSTSLENIYVSEAHRAIYSEISYLKRRIHLVEGERKANYESNEEELKQNEVLIQELRATNQELKKEHKEVLKSNENYFIVVSKCLGDEKGAYPFRGKTLEETIDILECKIGDVKNKLNLLQYKRREVREELESILKEEKKIKSAMNRKNFNPREKELRRADNNIALMQMKITEAENIQSKYRNMIAAIKQENYMKDNQINEMENVVVYQVKEVAKIRKVLAEAIRARKDARAHLTEVEENTLKEYSEREQKLFESRVQLKEIREKMDAIGTKLTYPKFHMIHRDSSLAEGLYVMGDPLASADGKASSSLEKVYNTLMEMTGESEPAAIIIRFQQQRDHAIELENDENKVKSELRKCKLRKRFLQDKLNQLQFSGGVKREQLDRKIGDVEENITRVIESRNEDERSILTLTEIMDELFKKLTTICISSDIKVPGLSPTTGLAVLGGKVVNILNVVIGKIELAMQEQDNVFRSPVLSPMDKDEISENESFSSFRYGSMTGLNVIDDASLRRTSAMEGLTPDMDQQSGIQKGSVTSAVDKRSERSAKVKLVDKRSDSSEEEEATTRNLIKRQSQVLVDAKTRKGRFNTSVAIMPIKNKRN